MRAACRRRGGTAGASRASRRGGAPAPWRRAGPGLRMPEEVPQPAHPQRGTGRARRGRVPHRRPRCRSATPVATRDRWRHRQRARWRQVPLACPGCREQAEDHTRGAEHVPEDHADGVEAEREPEQQSGERHPEQQPRRSCRFCECDAHIVGCGSRIPQCLCDRPENLGERCAHGRRDLPGGGEIDPRPALGLDGVEQRDSAIDPVDHCPGLRIIGVSQVPPGDDRHRPGLQQHGQRLHRGRGIRRTRLRLSRQATRPHHHGCTSSMSSRSPAITSRPA